MFKKNDKILFIVILAAALISAVSIYLTHVEGETVVITVNGEEYASLPLNTDTEIRIETDNGDYNILTIQDGEVNMTDANCPDKLCVEHSAIHYDNESIVCLPHKVVAEIVNGETGDVDAVAR